MPAATAWASSTPTRWFTAPRPRFIRAGKFLRNWFTSRHSRTGPVDRPALTSRRDQHLIGSRRSQIGYCVTIAPEITGERPGGDEDGSTQWEVGSGYGWVTRHWRGYCKAASEG